jgi:hypothetical protein
MSRPTYGIENDRRCPGNNEPNTMSGREGVAYGKSHWGSPPKGEQLYRERLAVEE